MDLKKTNKELISGLVSNISNLLRYKRELAKLDGLESRKDEIKQAEKNFNELVTEAYYIAFANGRLGDLLDDIVLMQKNPEEDIWHDTEELEIIMNALQEKQKQHLEELKNMPSKDVH